jgi:hypothetical protein
MMWKDSRVTYLTVECKLGLPVQLMSPSGNRSCPQIETAWFWGLNKIVALASNGGNMVETMWTHSRQTTMIDYIGRQQHGCTPDK